MWPPLSRGAEKVTNAALPSDDETAESMDGAEGKAPGATPPCMSYPETQVPAGKAPKQPAFVVSASMQWAAVLDNTVAPKVRRVLEVTAVIVYEPAQLHVPTELDTITIVSPAA